MDYQIDKEINIDVSYGEETYEMNITPILNAIIKFVLTILDKFLPAELKEVL